MPNGDPGVANAVRPIFEAAKTMPLTDLPDADTAACVVISHYNAWKEDQLLALLDQTQAVPAGRPFHTRVVVNAALDKPLVLPARHAGVEVLYRENTGFNIGAWDLGWRTAPRFGSYLFLQEECVILKAGWLDAFVRLAARPTVGLVGESLVWERSWQELEATQAPTLDGSYRIDGQAVDRFTCFYENLRRHGVDRGRDGSHLQTLVLAARREVLERIGPFPLGNTYGEAVSVELILSKKVQAMGLQTRQVGWLAFTYVLHPQWQEARWRAVLKNTVVRWMPSAARQAVNRWRLVRSAGRPSGA